MYNPVFWEQVFGHMLEHLCLCLRVQVQVLAPLLIPDSCYCATWGAAGDGANNQVLATYVGDVG